MFCSSVYRAIEKFIFHNKEIFLREIHLVNFNDNTNRAFFNIFLQQSTETYKNARPLPPTARPSLANENPKLASSTKRDKPLYEWYMEPKTESQTDVKEFIKKPTEKPENNCVICLEPIENPMELKQCHHVFCEDCISDFLSRQPRCPICNVVYGKLYGDQPEGVAKIFKEKHPLPGYDSSDTWVISYEFCDGFQKVSLFAILCGNFSNDHYKTMDVYFFKHENKFVAQRCNFEMKILKGSGKSHFMVDYSFCLK